MKDSSLVNLSQLNKTKRRKRFQKIISIFCAISVFITCYLLIIPAITMSDEDADTICGMVAHTHSDECYDTQGNLICELPEHEHDMPCYARVVQKPGYICGLDYEHTHSDDCFENGVLNCGLIEHTHSDDCLPQMPAQEFDEEIDGIKVYVTSPEGALPVSSSLSVSRVASGGVNIPADYTGVKLAFADAEGNEIMPAKAVYIRINTGANSSAEKLTAIKLDKTGNTADVEPNASTSSEICFTDESPAIYYLPVNADEYVNDAVENAEPQEAVLDDISISRSPVGATDPISNPNGANNWQIVSGKYAGNSSTYKTDVSIGSDKKPDEQLRGQKNIIPTDIENEFYVYLALDVNYSKLVTETVVNNNTGILITSDNSIKETGEPYGNQKNAETAWTTKPNSCMPAYSEPKGTSTDEWNFVFSYTIDGKEQKSSTLRYASLNKFNNGHVLMKLTDVWYVVGEARKSDADGAVYITLADSMVEKVLNALKGVQIGTMTDEMGNTVGSQSVAQGEGIIATEIVYSRTKTYSNSQWTTLDSPDNVEISKDGKSLNWTPKVSSLSSSNISDGGWITNVAELCYKIKYVPPKSAGLSTDGKTPYQPAAAKILTNANTEIQYITTSSSSSGTSSETKGSLKLTSPVIVGMLYELKASKVDQEGKPVSGAEFNVHTVKGDLTSTVGTAVSNDNGEVIVDGLPAGTYYITETKAPDNYVMDSNEYGPFVLNYTSNKTQLIGQGENKPAIYNPSSPIVITNQYCQAVELPHTGGTGTAIYILSGFVLIISASAVFYRRKRKLQYS